MKGNKKEACVKQQDLDCYECDNRTHEHMDDNMTMKIVIQYKFKQPCAILTGYDLKRETFSAYRKSKDNQSNQRKCRHFTYLMTRGMRGKRFVANTANSNQTTTIVKDLFDTNVQLLYFYVLILLNSSCSCHIISNLLLYFGRPEKSGSLHCVIMELRF